MAMKSNPDISIIIPVYGVEKYITKCIQSIKAQTFKNFEAILINDGTKDRSVELAEKAINGDPRFIILHKENGGQGSARNLGLDNARGEYIAFIDSDDWVEPDYLKAMYEKIKAENADVCTCDVFYIDYDGRVLKNFENNPEDYYRANDYLMAFWHVSNFMWDKLFHKTVFEGKRFDIKLRTNEDVHLLFELIYGKKIVSVQSFLYNYLQRPAATSKSAPPSLIEDRVKIKNKQFAFAKSIGRYEQDNQYIKIVYLKHFLFNTIVSIARYSDSYSSDINKLRVYLDKEFYNIESILLLIRLYPKTGLSLLLFKISPAAFKAFIAFWFRKHPA